MTPNFMQIIIAMLFILNGVMGGAAIAGNFFGPICLSEAPTARHIPA